MRYHRRPKPRLAGNALAARLAAIRAELSAVMAAPYGYGIAGPHRRRRDEDILLTIAADLNARLAEVRAS